MNDILIFLVKVTLGQWVMYAFYRIFLARETHFRLNRYYLLGCLLLPFTIPLLSIHRVTSEIRGILPVVADRIFLPAIQLGEKPDQHWWVWVPALVYLTGMAVSAFILTKKAMGLIVPVRKSWQIRSGSYRLRLTTEPVAPFSFFGTICMDEGTYLNNSYQTILMHEKVHVQQMHSIDIVLGEIITLFTWFNPVNRKIISALKETHEYLADAGVMEQTPDRAGYFQLLIQHAFGVQQGLANCFNHSLTFKRMTMMTKKKSGRYAGFKVLLVLPLTLMLIILLGTRDRVGALMDVSTSQVSGPGMPVLQKADTGFRQLDRQPEFQGGSDAMIKFIAQNVKYPEKARQSGVQGTVYVQFTVEESGKVSQISIKKGVEATLDAEAMRVVGLMPDWSPGEIKGKKVSVQMVLPISFSLDDKKK
jgi:TonB family protein